MNVIRSSPSSRMAAIRSNVPAANFMAVRSGQRLAARNVAAIVKAGAARLGFDPARFGGHSLRSGLVTTAVKRGVNLMKVCDQTGHKSLEMLRVSRATG
jgi:site-specific recombinase XerD